MPGYPGVPFGAGPCEVTILEPTMSWSLPQSREPEWMDDPAIGEADHLHALSALARINVLSRTAARLAAGVRALCPPSGPVRRAVVVDLACGGGDVTRALARRLARAGLPARVVGVDSSPRAIERARAAGSADADDVDFEIRDLLAEGCPPCDVAVSSLFLHHLDDADARRLLAGMAAACRVGIVVSDLVRSRLGLALAVAGTRLLSSSRVARVDGPLSVRAARTPAEYRLLAASAGLADARVTRVWPERVILSWRRPAGAVRPDAADAETAR